MLGDKAPNESRHLYYHYFPSPEANKLQPHEKTYRHRTKDMPMVIPSMYLLRFSYIDHEHITQMSVTTTYSLYIMDHCKFLGAFFRFPSIFSNGNASESPGNRIGEGTRHPYNSHLRPAGKGNNHMSGEAVFFT